MSRPWGDTGSGDAREQQRPCYPSFAAAFADYEQIITRSGGARDADSVRIYCLSDRQQPHQRVTKEPDSRTAGMVMAFKDIESAPSAGASRTPHLVAEARTGTTCNKSSPI